MEPSILNSTKKVLGVEPEYKAFDLDILTHINSTFSTLHQLGIGPAEGFSVEDELDEWNDLGLSKYQLNWVKTYIYLKVRMLFDPPGTSYLLEAMNKQIAEHEWRLNLNRENELAPTGSLVID